MAAGRFGHQDVRGLPAPERGVLRYMPWPLRPLRNERHRSARRREGMGLWPSEAGDLSAKIPERSALKPRNPRKEATQAHIRRGRHDRLERTLRDTLGRGERVFIKLRGSFAEPVTPRAQNQRNREQGVCWSQ